MLNQTATQRKMPLACLRGLPHISSCYRDMACGMVHTSATEPANMAVAQNKLFGNARALLFALQQTSGGPRVQAGQRLEQPECPEKESKKCKA